MDSSIPFDLKAAFQEASDALSSIASAMEKQGRAQTEYLKTYGPGVFDQLTNARFYLLKAKNKAQEIG